MLCWHAIRRPLPQLVEFDLELIFLSGSLVQLSTRKEAPWLSQRQHLGQ